jgi:hypothetical protein
MNILALLNAALQQFFPLAIFIGSSIIMFIEKNSYRNPVILVVT